MRKTWPDSVRRLPSSGCRTHPVPSIAACVDGSANTSNTISTGALTVVAQTSCSVTSVQTHIGGIRALGQLGQMLQRVVQMLLVERREVDVLPDCRRHGRPVVDQRHCCL